MPGPGAVWRLPVPETFRLAPTVLSHRGYRYPFFLYGHAERIRVDDGVLAYLRDRHFGGRTPTVPEFRARYEPFGESRALALWLEIAQAVWWPGIGASF